MREGLQSLNLLELMKKNSVFFMRYFVFDGMKNVTIEQFLIDADTNEVQGGYFKRFIENAGNDMLRDLCLFCTGCKEMSMRKIGVTFDKDTEQIFASVCEQNITLPHANDYECFHRMMTAVLPASSKAFNSI